MKTILSRKISKKLQKKFRANAIINSRASVYGQEITEKQITRTVVDPYSVPMIAIVTDHGFATLLVSEKKAKKTADSRKDQKRNQSNVFDWSRASSTFRIFYV